MKIAKCTWDAVQDADGYNVYLDGVKVNEELITDTHFYIQGLEPDQYEAYATSVQQGVESDPSDAAVFVIDEENGSGEGDSESEEDYTDSATGYEVLQDEYGTGIEGNLLDDGVFQLYDDGSTFMNDINNQSEWEDDLTPSAQSDMEMQMNFDISGLPLPGEDIGFIIDMNEYYDNPDFAGPQIANASIDVVFEDTAGNDYRLSDIIEYVYAYNYDGDTTTLILYDREEDHADFDVFNSNYKAASALAKKIHDNEIIGVKIFHRPNDLT